MLEPALGDTALASMASIFSYCGWRLLQALFLTLEVLQQFGRQLRHRLWRRRRQLLELPQRTPSHLGVVIASEDAADIGSIAAVVCASAETGVRYITLCESSGLLLRASAVLRSELRSRGFADAQVLSAGETAAASGELAARALCVRVVTLGSGRTDLVVAAQRVCERVVAGGLPHEAVDEAAVDAELRANAGFPEPELILQCCPELFLGGLLPWHCRITQFIHIGSLRRATAERIREALVEYGGVHQRHGK